MKRKDFILVIAIVFCGFTLGVGLIYSKLNPVLKDSNGPITDSVQSFAAGLSNGMTNKFTAIPSGASLIDIGSDRSTLQKYVGVIAKQYYYKQYYTDYEQHYSDNNLGSGGSNKRTFALRNLNVSPESISRTNINNFDCSSFVTNVYMNALGYSFSNYATNSTSRNFVVDKNYTSNKSNNNTNFNKALLNDGIGVSTEMFTNIALQKYGLNENSVEAGKVYTGDSFVPFFYKIAPGDFNDPNKKSAIFKQVFGEKSNPNVNRIIQDGDIFVIRYDVNNVDSDKIDSTSGHTLLFYNNLFYHSQGKDYKDDEYSIRRWGVYGDYFANREDYGENDNNEGDFDSYLFASVCVKEEDKKCITYKLPKYIMVLRPINEVLSSNYTNVYTANNSKKTSSNLDFLADAGYLQYEEYLSKNVGGKDILLSSTNSINQNDLLKVNLVIKSHALANKQATKFTSISDSINQAVDIQSFTYTDSDHNKNIVTCTLSGGKYTCKNQSGKAVSNPAVKVNKANGKTTITYENAMVYPCNASGNCISKEFVLSYTYKVNTASNGVVVKPGMILSRDNKKYVMGDMSYRVEKTYSSVKINNKVVNSKNVKSINSYLDLLYRSTNQTTPLVNLYKSIFGTKLGDVANYESNIFDKTSDGNYVLKSGSNSIKDMLIPGMYGGTKVLGNVDGNRKKIITMDNFEIGDIIIVKKNGEINYYVYLGFVDNNYYMLESNLVTKLIFKRYILSVNSYTDSQFLLNLYNSKSDHVDGNYISGNKDKDKDKKISMMLYTADNFVVLRPNKTK